MLYRLVGFNRDLPDLHHDVFVRALSSLPGLQDPSAFKGWLTMIAVHAARTWITREKRLKWLWFLPTEELPEAESSAASGEVLHALLATYAVLDTLPVDERIAFALRFIDGMELTCVAAAAAFILGRIAQDQSRDYAGAARLFARYLIEQPGGAFAADAAGRLVEVADRMGDEAGARSAASRYLAAYPNGSHAAYAKSAIARGASADPPGAIHDPARP